MPGRDGRGPLGEGPGTGKGLGFCRVKTNSGPNNVQPQGWGLRQDSAGGAGRGCGFGRGRQGINNNHRGRNGKNINRWM